MAERPAFIEQLRHQNRDLHHYTCVGLDTDPRVLRKITDLPSQIHLPGNPTEYDLVVNYNRAVIEATADIAGCYKPNPAFYKFLGRDYVAAVMATCQLVHEIAPEVPLVIDGKYGDIGSTDEGHVYEAFDLFQGDAVTVHNYLGSEAMRPFLDRVNKGIFVLARTSNPGAGELQDLHISSKEHTSPRSDKFSQPYTLFEIVALTVKEKWNKNNNCGLVAGATYPEEAERIRDIIGASMPLLIPGVGAQGQTAGEIVPKALRIGELGVINSSRGIIFPKRSEGERLHDAIRRSALQLHKEIVEAQQIAT